MEPFELRFCCRARPKRSDETAISREDAGRGKYCAPAGTEQIEDVLAMFSEIGIVAIPILSGLHHHYVRI